MAVWGARNRTGNRTSLRRGGRIRHRMLAPLAAAAAVLTLLAGCATGQSSTNGAHSRNGTVISVNNTEPATGLVPANTNDLAGWKVVTLLFDGLVTFDDNGGLTYVGAKSIEPNADASRYTITLKDGLKFSNGERITAETYARSWSYAANAVNGMLGAATLSTIKGYDALQHAGVDRNAQLEGLRVVDPHTLSVTLNAPDSSFPYKVGDIAYLPLPSSAYRNIKAFGEHPVGNGPYKLKSWDHGRSIELEPNPDYDGPRKAKNGGIDFQIYQSLDAAYADLLSGHLDVLDTIPNTALATYRRQKGITAISRPGPGFTSITIPSVLDHFNGEEGQLRRAAIAHAIDRERIASRIFRGSVTPATDFLAPVIRGYSSDLDTAGTLAYNPAQARKLWAQADAISPWSGTFRIAYASDTTDKQWVDAAVNSIKNVLGIDATSYPFPTSAELSTAINERTVGAAFKSGLQSDYPHPEGYLVQGYGSAYADGRGLNNGDYRSAEFDSLIAQAAAQTDLDTSIALYQQAERVLLHDLPVIPLWYKNVTAAAASSVTSAPFNYMGVPAYHLIKK